MSEQSLDVTSTAAHRVSASRSIALPGARILISEVLGTFCLVLFGTGAIVVNESLGGQLGGTGISAVFGLIVCAMIFSFGESSGAHMNPAVSIAFAVAGRFAWSWVVPYVLAQCIGAVFASLFIHMCFPLNVDLGATEPHLGSQIAFATEALCSFVLMTVILNVAHGSKERGILAAVAIGAIIFVEALVAGPISGASMNPARSLGPALISTSFSTLWIYILAPTIGCALASVLWRWQKQG